MKQMPKLTGTYRIEVLRKNGTTEHYYIKNDVVNQGLDQILTAFVGSGNVWYIGLIVNPGTESNSDTMSSHSGWTESHTTYDEGYRQLWNTAAVSSQTLTNAANPATYTMNTSVTLYGLFLSSVETKNSTSGILWSTGKFRNILGGAETIGLTDNDTLKIIYELQATR